MARWRGLIEPIPLSVVLIVVLKSCLVIQASLRIVHVVVSRWGHVLVTALGASLRVYVARAGPVVLRGLSWGLDARNVIFCRWVVASLWTAIPVLTLLGYVAIMVTVTCRCRNGCVARTISII